MSKTVSHASIEQELKHVLKQNEKIYWTGHSENSSLLVAQDLFMIPFSLIWGVACIYWDTTDEPLFMALLRLPFVCAGLYLLFGRFYVRQRLLSSIFYAVTDQRVIVLSLWPRKRVRSLPLETLQVNLTVGRRGLGDLIFGNPDKKSALAARMPELSLLQEPACLSFVSVRNATELFNLIGKLQLQSAKSAVAW